MMSQFWRSNFGKLVMGGCGTQVGMLLTLSGLAALGAVCALCVGVNGLGLSLRQSVAPPPTAPVLAVAASETELDLLRQKVGVLADKVRTLPVAAPAPPLPTATPLPPPKPVVVADHSAVNLRSGPGLSYNRIGRLAKGESLEIVGRNPETSWWLVSTPGGQFAWAADMVVTAFNVDDTIPVVSIPVLLVQPSQSGAARNAANPALPPVAALTAAPPSLPLPPGTPTPALEVSRRFVQDTAGYKQLIRRLLLPTASESFSPDGQQIAITEQIKLYTITTNGARQRVLVEDEKQFTLVGGTVWSPDGQYLAFVADRLQDCEPCRTIGVVRLGDGALTWLEPPANSGLDLPRWTQEGRLLVTAYLEEPATGRVYVYNPAGQGEEAFGSYLLSSSHDGQKWFPWLPGRTWQDSEGTLSYYNN